MARKHWYTEGSPDGRPFVSRELAERFAAYWPGHSTITSRPADPFDGAIWNVQVQDGGELVICMFENRSRYVRPYAVR